MSVRTVLICLALPVLVNSQQQLAPAHSVTARVVEAGNAFLATLSGGERAKATFDFASPQRTGW